MNQTEPITQSVESKTTDHIISLKSEKESDEHKTVYFTPGYLKIDNISYLGNEDIHKFLADVADAIAKKTGDDSYHNIQPIVNVVASSKTNTSFKFAYVFLGEKTPGNRLYNVLIGKKPDGSEYESLDEKDKNGVKMIHSFIELTPRRMKLAQVERYWNEIMQSYSGKEDQPEFIALNQSYQDYVILSRLISAGKDEDKIGSTLEDYREILTQRANSGIEIDQEFLDSLENEEGIDMETIKQIKKKLIETSKKISICEFVIKPTYVKDPEPGKSANHLITTNLPTSITADILRPYFTTFVTTEGNFTATYPGLKEPISGPYPHVWIEKGGENKNIGHIVYESGINNYDARYAWHMYRKLNIRQPQPLKKGQAFPDTLVFEAVIDFYKERSANAPPSSTGRYTNFRPGNTLPTRNITLGAAIASKLNSFSIANKVSTTVKKEDDMIVEGGKEEITTNFASKNIFSYLSGRTKFEKKESVWSKPLPQNIREANQNTINIGGIAIAGSTQTIMSAKRKYDPHRRDDGNTKVFY